MPNPYHEPAGSPQGGQFAPKEGGSSVAEPASQMHEKRKASIIAEYDRLKRYSVSELKRIVELGHKVTDLRGVRSEELIAMALRDKYGDAAVEGALGAKASPLTSRDISSVSRLNRRMR